MRKFVWIVAVLTVVALAVPAGARSVSNASDSGMEVAAFFGEGTWTGGRTAVDGEGWASASIDSGDGGIGVHFWLYFGCEAADPGLLESVSVDGDGDIVTFSLNASGRDKFTVGDGTGVFHEGSSISYQYCAGGPSADTQSLGGVEFTIHMDGDGDLFRTSESNGTIVPGVSNDHFRWRGEYRPASGWIDLGVPGCDEPCTLFTSGQMGKWSWSSHGNNH